MKKVLALVLALLLTLGSVPVVFAAPDDPFADNGGRPYTGNYTMNGFKSSMFNFGYVKLATGEDLQSANSSRKCNNLKEKTVTLKNIERLLDEGNTFYLYAKWVWSKPFDSEYLEALLVMTDPYGNYYSGDLCNWVVEGPKRGYKLTCSWFFDATPLMERCRDDNGGSLPKGEYNFTLYFNEEVFRAPHVVTFK